MAAISERPCLLAIADVRAELGKMNAREVSMPKFSAVETKEIGDSLEQSGKMLPERQRKTKGLLIGNEKRPRVAALRILLPMRSAGFSNQIAVSERRLELCL
jgi:hypothetical protein